MDSAEVDALIMVSEVNLDIQGRLSCLRVFRYSPSTYIVDIGDCEYRTDEPCGHQKNTVMHASCPGKETLYGNE